MNLKPSIIFYALIFLASFCILNAQEDKTMYVFGHSLIVHDPPAIATPSNETTVPHWLHFLAQEAGNSIAVSGQYGFLRQHDNLPPISQWGFDSVLPAWDSDANSFSSANFDTILLTAGNFIQDQSSSAPYYDDPNTTPLSATLTIIDWLETNESTAVTYIYENWPDMAGFIEGELFPASESEFQNYNDYVIDDFHDWWIEYHDFIQTARPSEKVRMIPVGPIIAKLLTQTPLNTIPFLELYEDNASHSRSTLYFLAGLITYMAIYEQKAPVRFMIPNTVSAVVQTHFQNTINIIWDELLAFNNLDGSSRVFANVVLNSDVVLDANDVEVYPNSANTILNIQKQSDLKRIQMYDTKGRLVLIKNGNIPKSLDISFLSKGVYIVKLKRIDNTIMTNRIIKD